MSEITVGQIAAGVALVTGLLGGLKLLIDYAKKGIGSVVKSEIKPLAFKVDNLAKRIDEVEFDHSKNFLIACLTNVEQGGKLTETMSERFWETYDDYISAGGNSYIRDKVDKLKKQGVL